MKKTVKNPSNLKDFLIGVPSMGDSLTVKVRYGVGSSNH
jgi:hypothetical protein